MAQLVINDLKKEYPTRDKPLEILKGIDLQLNNGDNLAIIGPSGSGKSTLLNVLGTLDHPTSGTYRLNDVDPFALDEDKLASFRNANIGFIFQEHHLLPQLIVLENVLVMLKRIAIKYVMGIPLRMNAAYVMTIP